MKLLANRVHIQGVIVLLADRDKVHAQTRTTTKMAIQYLYTIFLKEHTETRNFKRFLKEIYKMWDGWMEALADSTKTRTHM